jgi:hypothetical protein
MTEFQELNGDQRREVVNTQQRDAAYREAAEANACGLLAWLHYSLKLMVPMLFEESAIAWKSNSATANF